MSLIHLKKWIKGEYSFSDIVDYFRGNIRYWMYYNASWLIRPHIFEQINYRVEVMKNECFHGGSCVMCGCRTINLQMANKACEGKCYPPMMNKKEWKKYNKENDEI